ncbi:MAG: hypothetical protein JSS83_26885 [Cyanobacteria bacterium SZAS LIN-3]|nr:hypothetical protein [Cyanobacteria bacterium SZAS LIN-3]
MPQVKQVLDRLMREIRSLCRHGKTQRRHALSRYGDLSNKYRETELRYYRPAAQRKLRSADSLYHFPEAQLLAEQAMHSINRGDFETAHEKITQGLKVVQEDVDRRFMEDFQREARIVRNQRRDKGRRA